MTLTRPRSRRRSRSSMRIKCRCAASTATGLQQDFPWLCTDDLTLGAFGMSGEGWFDGYSLLQAFRRKARQLGVVYVQDEAVDLLRSGHRVTGVRTANSGDLSTDVVVNAAGAARGERRGLGGIFASGGAGAALYLCLQLPRSASSHATGHRSEGRLCAARRS